MYGTFPIGLICSLYNMYASVKALSVSLSIYYILCSTQYPSYNEPPGKT